MMSRPTVTILLPAHDEAACIRPVIEGVRLASAELGGTVEILVVDDGSCDGTAGIARDCGARVVSHHSRLGAGAAIRTGLLEARGEVVVLMDADASYPAEAIPRLLAELPSCRQVVGARTTEAGKAPRLRAAVKFLLRKLGEFLVRRAIPDLNSGMRAFRRRDAMAFIHLLPDGHSCVSTLTLCFLGMGLPVRFVPIDYRPRVGRSKFRPVSDTARFVVQILRSVAYFAPLRVFLAASFLFLALGTGKSAWDVRSRGGLEESDIILFIFSAATAVIGLLADLIVKLGARDLFRDLHPASRDTNAGDQGGQ